MSDTREVMDRLAERNNREALLGEQTAFLVALRLIATVLPNKVELGAAADAEIQSARLPAKSKTRASAIIADIFGRPVAKKQSIVPDFPRGGSPE